MGRKKLSGDSSAVDALVQGIVGDLDAPEGSAQNNPADPVDLKARRPAGAGSPAAGTPGSHVRPQERHDPTSRSQHRAKSPLTLLEEKVEALMLRVERIEAELMAAGRLRPPPMSSEGVRQLRAENACAMVRVLETHKSEVGHFHADQLLRLDAFPHLEAFVGAGLRVERA